MGKRQIQCHKLNQEKMAIKLKSFIKRIVPSASLYLLSRIYHRPSAPYSLKSALILPRSISDFFVWNPSVAKTEFIAENIRSLLIGDPIEVVHCFRFFSKEGKLIHEEKYTRDDFFSRITLSGPQDNSDYSSFTHHVEAENLQNLIKSLLGHKKRSICEQNRGYCIYYPSFESSVGSCVHGNFGAISREGNMLARQRSLHLYTPAYRFESKNTYDLAFNNPTNSTLNIRLLFNNDSTRNEFLHIKRMGTYGFRIKRYTGSLSFESRLPICRAIIFKNPDQLKSGNFDVLHS